MFCGRRGDIVWKKGKILGVSRDYDTYQAVGILFPFFLTDLVHTFGWGEFTHAASAIPLRRDKGFTLSALAVDWCGPLMFLSGLCFLPLLCSGVSVPLTVLTGVTFLVSIAVVVPLLFQGGRDRDIRLLLGKHAWGSSDPATWHPSLLEDVVDPRKAFHVRSFAELAERALEDRDWSRAMWAARLCVALEDEDRGEQLTDDILNSGSVWKKLRRVRSKPWERKKAFGPAIPLGTWVQGDIKAHVDSVSSWF